jgi:serine-type D-Ala-D-Ala carboxypeptidase/endopeptidase
VNRWITPSPLKTLTGPAGFIKTFICMDWAEIIKMRKRSWPFLFVFMLICAAVIPSASHGFDPAVVATLAESADKEKIDPFAYQLIKDQIVVGLVIGIVKDGQSQIITYGETIKGSGIAPDGDTLYEIGSVTKVFTGVLLASLIQSDDVNLTDPLQKYLPPSVTAPVADGKPITLEHLATHTSGLPRMPDNFKPADPLNPYADYTIEQMYLFLNGHVLRRPPGQYEYSNYAMGLLGHVLAHHKGMTYEQFLRDRISKPMGMKDTGITLNEDQQKRLTPPYNAALKPAENWDIPALAGAGAIRSSANDMIKFIMANLKKDHEPFSEALRLAQVKRHSMEDGLSMALGWHLARDGATLWHNGGTGGYHSWLAIAPDRGIGVVVLTNTANMRLDEFGEQVTAIALGREVKPPQPRKSIEVNPTLLKSYTGYFAITPEFGLSVTVEKGRLMVQATDQDRFPVFSESKSKFFYKVVDAEITFVPDKRGQINKLILHQNGQDIEAFRKDPVAE